MKPPPRPEPPPGDESRLRLFVTLFGAFLGLTLLKFGNPPIMETWVSAPRDIYELLLGSPWPIGWAYGFLAIVTVLGLVSARWQVSAPLWLVALPLAWLIWQCLAASHSLDARTSWGIVVHFAACLVCFYLGLFSLSRAKSLAPFWLGLTLGFLFLVAVGWEQHFGGLADTRRYFFLYLYPKMKSVPPEYFKRLASDRVFSTLFYPNTLAGALILLLPAVLAAAGSVRRLTIPARGFVAAVIAVGALACLYWSGSKTGWLLMLLLGIIVLLALPLGRQFRTALVGGVLLLGLVGFFWHFAGFFRKGATSVSARMDYWQAAARIAKNHPLLGSGPGTFGISYQAIKRPESEPAKLTHNDYLQQACDSGLAGFLAYSAFILGVLVWSAPNFKPSVRRQEGRGALAGRAQERAAVTSLAGALAAFSRVCASAARQTETEGSGALGLAQDWQRFALWLGVLGWSLQGLFEFGLYIPALAWPAFAFMGWLCAKVIDNSR
ncbi:MAG: O-antigen ligase family protein [Verrucomicrobiota bacterium]|jgi:O-antigen ligase